MFISNYVIDAFEEQGWRVVSTGGHDEESYIEIENWSPLGEDLCETIWLYKNESLATAIRRYADDFDPEDHAALLIQSRGKHGIPRGIQAILDDANCIQKMLDDLAEAIEKLESNKLCKESS